MKSLGLLFLVGLATGFISEKLLVSSQSPVSTADDLYIEGRSSGELPIDDEDGEDDNSGSGSGDYDFTDISEAEKLLERFLNFSETTFSETMVPVQPQPTADSPHDPPTTAADSQDQITTVKTTPFKFPDGDNRDKEVLGTGTITGLFTESTSPSSTSVPTPENTVTEFSTDISVTEDMDEDDSQDEGDILTSKDDGENILIEEEAKDRGRTYEVESPEEVTSENLWERTEVLAAVIACGVVGFICAVLLLLLLAYRMKKKDEGSYDLGDTKLSTTAYHKAPTKEFYA